MKKLTSLLTLLCLIGTLPLLTGCGKPAEPAKPLGPAESMQALMDGVANQNMEAVWNFFPATYQQQINDQSHALAEKLDPELYNGIFNTAQRVTKLLKDKKEFILKNKSIQGLPVPQEKLNEFWDPTVNILDTIANGEISSVEKLKKLDGKTYFTNEANTVLKEVFQIAEMIPRKEGELSLPERIKQSKVTLVSEEDDKATIKIEAPGEEPREEVMVKVEDKWIPENMAKKWSTQLEQTRESIAEITPESMAAQKEKIMPVLNKVNETVAKLENAKTEEEFDQEVSMMIAPLAIMAQLQFGRAAMGAPATPSLGDDQPVSSEKVVTIIVNRKPSDSELEQILGDLEALMQGTNNLNVSPSKDGAQTIITVSPIDNVEDFAKKLKFGKVTNVDSQKRSITLELAK